MKSTTVTLYDDNGEDLPPQTFPSAREAREAEAACRARLLAVLGIARKDSAKLSEVAWLVREHVARVFYETRGYPHGTPGLTWLEEKLSASEQGLMKLSAMGAPAKILENERKLIAQRKGWIEAWRKEHGDE